MSDGRFLERVMHIYQAARESDDGTRCMVAPSPDLHDRIKAAIRSMQAAGGLPTALSIRASEPRALGFNDGVIIPPEDFPLGTPPSAIRAAAARVTAPLRGKVRVIVVLVEFSDKSMAQTSQALRRFVLLSGSAAEEKRP